MRYFSLQEILCIGLIILYLIGIVDDIFKKQYKNLNFFVSIFFLFLSIVLTFFVAPAYVSGSSMEPTLHDKDILFLNKLDRDFTTNDIVVFRSNTLKKSLIKRIVGVPGDTVYMVNGDLYVNDILIEGEYETIATFESFDKVVVPENSFFVMGDNRPGSVDSRSVNVGFVNKKYIYGKIIK